MAGKIQFAIASHSDWGNKFLLCKIHNDNVVAVMDPQGMWRPYDPELVDSMIQTLNLPEWDVSIGAKEDDNQTTVDDGTSGENFPGETF